MHIQPSLTFTSANDVEALATAEGGRVCFLYIAEPHQALHSVSAAIELARMRPDVDVDLVTTNPATVTLLTRILQAFRGPPVGLRLAGPKWLRDFSQAPAPPPKAPMLLANARRLSGYDVIVTPERTTAVLRKFGVRGPRLICTRHGAGDRIDTVEPRLKSFDLVFAAGQKDRDRLIQSGLVSPGRCAVVGYPKFDVVDALHPKLPRLFPQDRPTALYNPHFDPKLSSWPQWGPAVLAAFAAQSRYNLIFAPHLRLFEGVDPTTIRSLAPFIRHPGIYMDLGSRASIDMTYTQLADVYLGDVSSQVYEFLRIRRPCLFLNSRHAQWRGVERYRNWRFGPVMEELDDVVAAVDSARNLHTIYRPAQDESFRMTFDLTGESSSVRAARAIDRVLTETYMRSYCPRRSPTLRRAGSRLS